MHFLKSSGCGFFLLLLFTTSIQGGATAEPGMKVWAIGDYVRIDPLSGKAFEDNPLLFPESLTGNYAQKNLVWEGAMGSPGMWNHKPVLDRNLRQDRDPTLLVRVQMST
jgi:hypothetical protein